MSGRARKRKRKEAAQRRSIKFLAVIGSIISAFMICCLAALLLFSSWLTDLPAYDKLEQYTKSGITTIYADDRETILAKLYLENRIETAINKVSPDVLHATVAIEDERFYDHRGVDLRGIIRAIVANVRGGHEGASTITQQLIRNTILLDEMNEQTMRRKIREAYLAVKVEESYTKDQILMMYLNVVNYGDGCYGIEAASRNYFGKSANELSLAEAALLVGIPQSPTANNPRTNPDNATVRRNLVLDRMLSNGYITEAQHDKATKKKIKLVSKSKHDDDVSNIAPYFVDYIRWLLAESGQFSESELAKGGLTVYTTLNPTAQNAAVKAIENGLSGRDENLDASLVTVDPSNGHIIAMVGGRDYNKDQFNLAAQMSRQAGSSFKVFALMAALDAGVDPSTSINADSPAQIGNWEVNNVEGEGGGYMSLKSATTESINTVYARLVHTIGPQRVVKMAQACGIQSELKPYDAIALGVFGVNTLEMANAYATIANGGMRRNTVAVSEIVDASGETVFTVDDSTNGERVLSPALAKTTTDILKTVVEYGTGSSASLWCGQEAAGKTGTTEEFRDVWFCGFTPQYSTSLWVGYRQEKSVGNYGGEICAPIWREYMDSILEGKPNAEFPTTDEQLSYTYEWNFDEWSNGANDNYNGE